MKLEFLARFNTWLADCQNIVDRYYLNSYGGRLESPQLVAEQLNKRVRIWATRREVIREGGEDRGSCWAFVDLETGDIFKPATWRAPAKHARGNIFDEGRGLTQISAFGPKYLK